MADNNIARTERKLAQGIAPDTDVEQSTSDIVVDHINSAILAGRYVPGQRLIEADLTGALGVSRGPVREAFRRLDALGIVRRTMHRGIAVRKLSRTEALDLLVATLPLDLLAARLSAEKFKSCPAGFDSKRYASELKAFVDPKGATASMLQRRRFYELLMEISGNSQLPTLMPNMRIHLLRAQVASFFSEEEMREHFVEYVPIARAILRGDANAAQKALDAHVAGIRGRLLTLPDEAFGPES